MSSIELEIALGNMNIQIPIGTMMPHPNAQLNADYQAVLSNISSINLHRGLFKTLFDYGAIGDGSYHPLSERFTTLALAQFAYPAINVTSLTQSIDWAATQAAVHANYGKALYITAATYVLTDTVRILNQISLVGSGYYSDVNHSRMESMSLGGTTFLFINTGPKQHTVKGSTDCRANGGQIDNTADADFGVMDKYFVMSNYYNNDATSSTPATPKLLSAGFYVGYGVAGLIMRDFKIMLGFNGASIAGYINKTMTLADNWDLGLYMDNSRYCHIENVQVLGYWRLNGLLIRSGAMGGEDALYGGKYSGAEENKFYNCVFQGWKSVACRSIDMFRCMDVTSTYFEVPWADNHPFDISSGFVTRGENGPRSIPVSSMSKIGYMLRFTTVGDQTPHVVVGDPICPRYIGNGVAGTVFRDCRMHGMWHSSEKRISDPSIIGAMPPSSCMEVSGTRVRGLRIEGTKLQTVDDVGLHLHQCIDFYISVGRFEGSTPNGGLAGIRNLTTQPRDDVTNPYAVRETFRVHLGDMEQPAADFTPLFGNVPSKFSTTGFWKPNFGSATFAQGGLFIGGANSYNLLSEYVEAGFTPILSFANGTSFTTSGVTKAGTSQRIGNWATVSISYSGNLQYNGTTGDVGISLPYRTATQSNMNYTFPCLFSGLVLPTGYTTVLAEVAAGDQFVNFVFCGPSKANRAMVITDIPEDSFFRLSFTGSYGIYH